MLKRFLLAASLAIGVVNIVFAMEEISPSSSMKEAPEKRQINFNKNKMSSGKAYFILGQYYRLNGAKDYSPEHLKKLKVKDLITIIDDLKENYTSQPEIQEDIDFLLGNVLADRRLREVKGKIPQPIIYEISKYLGDDLGDLLNMIESDVLKKQCIRYGSDRMQLFYTMISIPPLRINSLMGIPAFYYNTFGNIIQNVLVYLNCKKRDPNDPYEHLVNILKKFQKSALEDAGKAEEDIDFIIAAMVFLKWSQRNIDEINTRTSDPDLKKYLIKIKEERNKKYPLEELPEEEYLSGYYD